MKIVSSSLIWAVRAYQYTISPIIGANCRFQPSCSQYTIDAIREWGPLKGGFLGAKRILKCHPWGGHGWDPVPKNTEVNEP